MPYPVASESGRWLLALYAEKSVADARRLRVSWPPHHSPHRVRDNKYLLHSIADWIVTTQERPTQMEDPDYYYQEPQPERVGWTQTKAGVS